MGDRASELWPNGVKPNIGDSVATRSIGKMGRAIRVWEACPKCGHERWVKRNARGTCCQYCMTPPTYYGAENNRWNETKKTVTKSGIRVYVTPDHPFFPLAHRCAKYGYAILEHRLVMATQLNRCLESWEVVHHIDGDNCNKLLDKYGNIF